jgi:hypothetical protein
MIADGVLTGLIPRRSSMHCTPAAWWLTAIEFQKSTEAKPREKASFAVCPLFDLQIQK